VEKYREIHPFNEGWLFSQNDGEGRQSPEYDAKGWEAVTLPHFSGDADSAYQQLPWQGICWYRKTFDVARSAEGRSVAVRFGGAMQVAEVWLNGEYLLRRAGGYQCFSVDITDRIVYGGKNVIAVRLDNRDTAECPPGKPTADLHFNYPGGL
jgi:beta-galactosidase